MSPTLQRSRNGASSESRRGSGQNLSHPHPAVGTFFGQFGTGNGSFPLIVSACIERHQSSTIWARSNSPKIAHASCFTAGIMVFPIRND